MLLGMQFPTFLAVLSFFCWRVYAAPHATPGRTISEIPGSDDPPSIPQLLYYGPVRALPLPTTPHCNIELTEDDPEIWGNDLVQGRCSPYILLFARGSINPGNIGTTVGPCLVRDIKAIRPNQFAIQGVDYKGTLVEFALGGSFEGANDIADKISLANSKCPGSGVVLSGYSQGAQIIHKAVDTYLDESLYHVVKAIVLFGDPKNGTVFPGSLNQNVKYFCHEGDHFYKNIIWDSKEHHTYRDDTGIAAEFINSVLPTRLKI